MISFRMSRAHLFNACYSYGFFHPPVFALAGQFIVDLAGAENDSLHLVGALSCGAALRNHTLEVGACGIKQKGFCTCARICLVAFPPSIRTWQHAIKAGLGLRVAQQRLGSEYYQLELKKKKRKKKREFRV